MSGIHWFDEVTSTMDKVKELAMDNAHLNVFAAVAQYQSKGRASKVTNEASKVSLKWPNDVLIGDKKVCGVLMEVDRNRLLVGIGCNVETAPEVSPDGSDSGRPSTCLADHSESIAAARSAEATSPFRDSHKQLAIDIFNTINAWSTDGALGDSEQAVLANFQELMSFQPQRIRLEGASCSSSGSSTNDASSSSSSSTRPTAMGCEVLPMFLNKDGTLEVKVSSTGENRTLIADYLW